MKLAQLLIGIAIISVTFTFASTAKADSQSYTVTQLKAISNQTGIHDLLCGPKEPITADTAKQQKEIVTYANSQQFDKYYAAIAKYDVCVKE